MSKELSYRKETIVVGLGHGASATPQAVTSQNYQKLMVIDLLLAALLAASMIPNPVKSTINSH
jgi:hypothetical protein